MELSDNTASGRQVVEAYGDGGFRVSGVLHTGSLLIFADRATPWQVSDIAAVSGEALSQSLRPVAEAEPPVDVLLLGCGETAVPVPKAVRAALRAAGVVVEPMDTGAACRTFNLLMAEERRAAAALIAVG